MTRCHDNNDAPPIPYRTVQFVLRREKEEKEEEEGEGERMNDPWNGVDTQESSSSAQQCDTSLSLS